MSEQQANPPASFPKRVFALIFDTVTIFSLAGYLIGWLTGELDDLTVFSLTVCRLALAR